MYSKLILSIFILLLLNSCSRTIEDFSIEENEYTTSLTEECEKLHFHNYSAYAKNNLKIKNQRLIEYYYSHNINIKKVEEFEKIDIDLIRASNTFHNQNYVRMSLVAHTIIEGTILSEENINTEKEKLYTKSHKIQVNKVFKKAISWTGSKIIDVKTSGYLSHSPYFYGGKGDDVLLFINPQMKMDGYKNENLENAYSLWSEFKIIEDGKKIRGAGDRDSVYQKIKLIHQINNFNDFINDFLEEECM